MQFKHGRHCCKASHTATECNAKFKSENKTVEELKEAGGETDPAGRGSEHLKVSH